MKKKDNSLTLSKVISNNLYALNLIRKNCFGLVFYKRKPVILNLTMYLSVTTI